MNPIRLVNDLLHTVDSWRCAHPFGFWATIYCLIFFGPVVTMIAGDITAWWLPLNPMTLSIRALFGR